MANRMKNMLYGICFCLPLPLPACAEAITLLYNERPPYLIAAKDQSASGLTGTPAAKAFAKAGIAVHWSMLSTKRQVQTLTENAGASCAIGWYHKPEREQFAKFSKPIYRDRPFVGIAAAGFKLEKGTKLTEVLQDKNVRILLKEGFSYGDIDPWLLKVQATIVNSNGEVVEMMQMIKARRADLMFAAREEADYLLRDAGFKSSDFQLIEFPDMPQGKTRHLMCSKKVPDEIMKKIDAAIDFKVS